MFGIKKLQDRIGSVDKKLQEHENRISALSELCKRFSREKFAEKNKPKYAFGTKAWAWKSTFLDGSYVVGRIGFSHVVTDCEFNSRYSYDFLTENGITTQVYEHDIHTKEPKDCR